MHMKKAFIAVIGAVVIAWLGFLVLNTNIYQEKQVDEKLVDDPKNGWYLFSGEWVHLEEGKAEVPAAPDSASVVSYQYFGNETYGDLDGDGDEDAVFLITQDSGGSGTFFYVVGAIREGEHYRGTQAMFIGDRIAPQTTEFRDGQVIVNYAERTPGEPFTTPPSFGKSLYVKYSVDTNDFGEVVQNFEGEHINTDTFARVQVKIGETVSVLGISITLNEVLEDSRCPRGVECVWAGQVRLASTVTSGLGSAEHVFIEREVFTTETEEITLLQATPSPREGVTLQPAEYVFTFEIKKR